MAGLLEHDKTQADPQQTTPGAPSPPADPPAVAEPVVRPCAHCGASLDEGQDWCLECGSAQPGRLGSRPGRRAALTVLATCAVLATGAAAAAYAALSSEAQGIARLQPPPPAPAVVAQPAPTVPPVAETPTVRAPRTASAGLPDVPAVKAPAGEPASPSVSSGPSGGAGTAGSTAGDTGGDASTGGDGAIGGPAPIDLSADAVSTYDPFGRGGTRTGDPADAVDGRSSTAWEAPVGSEGEVRIGLAVTLEEARTLSRLAFRADTPGFTVEAYGSRAASLPPTILDARWERLGTRRDVGISEEIDLKGKYRHVVLWVTAQPADVKVAIPEIQLFD